VRIKQLWLGKFEHARASGWVLDVKLITLFCGCLPIRAIKKRASTEQAGRLTRAWLKASARPGQDHNAVRAQAIHAHPGTARGQGSSWA